ncbi:MAG: LLM class flavin-dependent oxidoreductase [Steroidobacteraceae bacterium]
MKNIKYGPCGVLSDAAMNGPAAVAFEQSGFDFIIWCDQMCMSIPRSIWTEDLNPAAKLFDIDAFMDPWPLVTDAALHTRRVQLGITVCDVFRRLPANLAQLALTLDHYSKGRFFLALGTGEMRHFKPYGIPRQKPFTQLEEAVKLTKLLMASDGLIDYEGPVWNLRNAVMTLKPYGAKPPPILVAGSGRAHQIAGEHGDGWITMIPFASRPEQYADDVRAVKQFAQRAGRDPNTLRFHVTAFCLIAATEEEADQLTRNPIIRWDAIALVTDTKIFGDWGHPIRDDYTYARDLISMDWSRDDALAIAAKTPPEMVRKVRFTGTPETVAMQLQPYIAAGAQWINIVNVAAFVGTGHFGEAAAAQGLIADVVERLRKINGQPSMRDQGVEAASA